MAPCERNFAAPPQEALNPVATVVITTKNRRQDLAVALESAVRQSVPLEVIVIDDGSNDGTSDLVRSAYPSVRLLTHATSAGLIARRNEGAHLASTPYIFSIDDDAEFSTPDVVRQTLADFDNPRVAAVAIPYTDVRKGPAVHQRAQSPDAIELTAFYIGTAHAIRRDVFLAAGGYRAWLIHQGEERDLCIRLLDAGYVVRRGRSDLIHHYESPRRDLTRINYYARRNDTLFGWCNVPLPLLFAYWPLNLFAGLRLAARNGYLMAALRGTLAGFLAVLVFCRQRQPVRTHTYLLHRRLARPVGARLADVEPQLSPLVPPTP